MEVEGIFSAPGEAEVEQAKVRMPGVRAGRRMERRSIVGVGGGIEDRNAKRSSVWR